MEYPDKNTDDKTESYLKRLGTRYRTLFTSEAVEHHIQILNTIDCQNAYVLEINTSTEKEDHTDIEITLFGIDFPGLFSIITGTLTSLGMNIKSGEIFTCPKESGTAGEDTIIDLFRGNLKGNITLWEKEIHKRLSEIYRLLLKEEHSTSIKTLVNEWVSQYLKEINLPAQAALFPVDISIEQGEEHYTTISVTSQDTPCFLFALSTALNDSGAIIERVSIKTEGTLVKDSFDIRHPDKQKGVSRRLLEQIQFSVLLTKQFTFFLDKAADPFTALNRFETLVKDLTGDEGREWIDKLNDPTVLDGLATILGASDFLWEDFIRLQYESIIPMLSHPGKSKYKKNHYSRPYTELKEELYNRLGNAHGYEEQKKILNNFKDSELFKLDLDHILGKELDFLSFSKNLSRLAELILSAAIEMTFEELTRVYGTPKTVAGLPAKYALFGLGKLGGEALGYASDIEVLFIYSDNGQTDGQRKTDNSHFFQQLVKESMGLIKTKREGIFQIDLRLRPWGSAGPLASSLEQFTRYYGRSGDAHSFERMALIRLRGIHGDDSFIKQVEHIRDSFIYVKNSVDIAELRSLRNKQVEEKNKKGVLNAKYSPGALVDLEYSVQLLQIEYGDRYSFLRTPSIHNALNGLEQAEILTEDIKTKLIDAYHFFRKLINGLRILRGSALDLFIPNSATVEFIHLARRMGYEQKQDLTPADQLFIDFDINTANIRAFIKKSFGREAIPGPGSWNIADAMILTDIDINEFTPLFERLGFLNHQRTWRNLSDISGAFQNRNKACQAVVLASIYFPDLPDADMALNNWERFVHLLEKPDEYLELILTQPTRLQLMLQIFAHSHFLSSILIQQPYWFDWATDPVLVNSLRKKSEMEKAIENITSRDNTFFEKLREFKKQEILRIGARDICLKTELDEITLELSYLADVVIETALKQAWETVTGKTVPVPFSVLAFGKLGGNELNYSSDVDLLCIYDEQHSPDSEQLYSKVIETLQELLSRHTQSGFVYRVDFRLRPFGTAGPLAVNLERCIEYYNTSAGLWELQAAIKLRRCAGDKEIGESAISQIRKIICSEHAIAEIAENIKHMREPAIRRSLASRTQGIDVKNGSGGIRDIEFLVQGLQLYHAEKIPGILTGNTLRAISALTSKGILPTKTAEELTTSYIFLRRLEHLLQIYDDRQIHALPAGEDERTALARRILGTGADNSLLSDKIAESMKKTEDHINTILYRFCSG